MNILKPHTLVFFFSVSILFLLGCTILNKNTNRPISAEDTKTNKEFFDAITFGNIDRIKILINTEKIEINMTNVFGKTALMMAANLGRTAIVEVLIKAGADISGKSRHFRETALMMAAENSHISIVETLIRVGVDTSVKNHRGMTALDLAKDRLFKKDHLVIKALEEAMR